MTMKKGKGSVSTLRDVAKKADVSIATASRVLSNSDYPVSQTLRRRIIRVAEELNYTPNLLGKMLKNNTYHAVGVIVPTLQNPFFNQVILGVESAAREKNYEVVIYSSHRSAEQERSNILNLLKNRVMALIIISIDDKGDTLQRYIDCGGRVALLEADFHLEGAIIAKTDYLLAGRLAARYLAAKGHRRICLWRTRNRSQTPGFTSLSWDGSWLIRFCKAGGSIPPSLRSMTLPRLALFKRWLSGGCLCRMISP